MILASIDKDINENECKDFLVGTSYTIADFQLIGFFRWVMTNPALELADFYKSTIAKFPRLSGYIKKQFEEFYKVNL